MLRFRVLPLVTLCTLFAAEANGQGLPPWPMFRGDAAHTGRSTATAPDAPSLDWMQNLDGLAYSSASLDAAGNAYLGTSNSVTAFSRDGLRLWSTPMDGYAISSPAIGQDGLIYVGNRDHNIYGIDAASGAIRRTFTTGDEVWSSPVVAADGTVYVGSFDGNLYALDTGSSGGRVVFSAGAEIAASPAIGPNGNLYVATVEGRVLAVTPSGSLLWQSLAGAGRGVIASPSVAGSAVYVGALDGRLYAFDAQTGAALWSYAAGDSLVSSPAVGTDGTLFVASIEGRMHAVDPSGTRQWERQLGGRIVSSPALDGDGILFVGSLDGTLHALDSADGSALWTYVADDPIWSSPSLSAGVLVFSSTGSLRSPGRLHRLVEAPFLVQFSPEPAAENETTAIVRSPDDFAATAGALFYRRGGERSYQTVALDPSTSGSFSASLPPEYVTPRGVEYYATLTDGAQTLSVPAFSPAANPAVLRVRVVDQLAERSFAPRTYRMTSIPLNIDDRSLASVFGDDYGPYDPRIWRLLCWRDEAYQEGPNACPPAEPGNAYFLISQTGAPFDVPEGLSVNTRIPHDVVLEPGWNLIGNPFAFPVDWADVEGQVAFVAERAYFDGREMIQSGDAVDVLRPWEGLFVRNAAPAAITLRIPPIESTAAVEPRENLEQAGLAIQVIARARDGSVLDSQNWVRLLPGPVPDDQLEAPAPASPLRLSLMKDGKRHAYLAQPLANEGAEWDLELEFSAAMDYGPIELILKPHGAQKEEFDLFVVDVAAGAIQEGPLLRIPDGEPAVRRLRLVAGARTFADSVRQEIGSRPTRLALEQNYPNPFNPATTISFSLPEDRNVRLDVFDVMGQHVRTLMTGALPRGRHTVRWAGTNSSGEPVSSGLYFYRLQAGSAVQSRSMLLVR